MWFKKKEKDFFKMLYEQGGKTLEGMDALCEFAENPSPENSKKVLDIKIEADELRRIIIEELNQTFITPIDREDIFDISRAIDDVMDYAATTVHEMQIYKVAADPHIKKMIDILRKTGRELVAALKNLHQYPNIAMEHATRAKTYENKMERSYREALAELFEGSDPIYMLKMREIYRHLSNAADRGDEAANLINNVIVKIR
jgi:predicted phosphate transport protein (TIGR00153 family)